MEVPLTGAAPEELPAISLRLLGGGDTMVSDLMAVAVEGPNAAAPELVAVEAPSEEG